MLKKMFCAALIAALSLGLSGCGGEAKSGGAPGASKMDARDARDAAKDAAPAEK